MGVIWGGDSNERRNVLQWQDGKWKILVEYLSKYEQYEQSGFSVLIAGSLKTERIPINDMNQIAHFKIPQFARSQAEHVDHVRGETQFTMAKEAQCLINIFYRIFRWDARPIYRMGRI